MKFTLKTNKVQEDRLLNFIFEHTRYGYFIKNIDSYEWVGPKEDL